MGTRERYRSQWAASFMAVVFLAACSTGATAPTSPSETSDPGQTGPGAGPANGQGLVVRFDFDASQFGGGPSDASPIRRVRGTLTIRYDPSAPSSVTITEIQLQPASGTGSGTWGPEFTAATALLSMGGGGSQANSVTLQVGGVAPLNQLNGYQNDYYLRFSFQPGDARLGPPTFQSFSYSVRHDREVYQARSGSVAATLLSEAPP
jgi:hypothetical protein